MGLLLKAVMTILRNGLRITRRRQSLTLTFLYVLLYSEHTSLHLFCLKRTPNKNREDTEERPIIQRVME